MARTVTIPLENTPGKLAEVARLLAKENVNIDAFVSEAIGEFGLVRFITNNPEKCASVLRGQGYAVSTTESMEITLPNRPGELARVCDALAKAGVNIESSFGTNPQKGDGKMVFRVDKPEEARKVFATLSPRVQVVNR